MYPVHSVRRLTLPKIKGRHTSKTWNKILTDAGQVSADSEEQLLTIVGAGGIVVSGVEGVPDVITIDGSGVQGAEWHEDEFTPVNNQITFSLSIAPTDSDSVFFFINGVVYDDTDDFTVSGQTITWLNTLFTIEDTDEVIIKYV